MPQSLRSILGKSNRVRKPNSRPAATQRQGTTTTTPSASQTSATGSSQPSSSPRKKKPKADDVLFPDKFDDLGISKLLAEELTLRDVVQAMRYIRSKMFTPVPPTGLHSTRTAEVLNYRISMPPIVTLGHLNAVLTSPSKVEREIAELLGKGVVRKVRVERRGGMGEALIETPDLETMIRKAQLSEGTRDAFLRFLRVNTTAQTLRGDGAKESDGDKDGSPLTNTQIDELVRAGFLTSSTRAAPGSTLHVRPEDRTTLTSIQHVSRFASGTVSAVGGQNAIHLAGGGGGGGPVSSYRDAEYSSFGFRLSVPGHGRYLKLVDGAVDWMREALAKTKWGEGPEEWLKERFEGGGLYGTRWKEFWGVEWEWVLGQAVGLGVVEVFETGSVGRGVRALGS